MNNLIFLYGLAGAGKNFVGQVIAEHSHYYFWDADLILTHEMLIAIKHHELFSKEMRDKYLNLMIKKINVLLYNHANIVVSQALYRQEQRLTLKSLYPTGKFVEVAARHSLIRQRLRCRVVGASYQYAKLIQPYFQSDKNDMVIVNNSNASEILLQVKKLKLIC